jgi:hypothetical protein
MGAIIVATTEAKASNPFVVQRGESVGVSAYGLATDETAVIQRLNSSGSWSDILDESGTLTATEYQTTISASGTYRVNKSATAGLAGVDID